MGFRIRIDTANIAREIDDKVLPKIAEAKREQLLRESRRQFRDDTGELRATIRIEDDTIVAIGDRRHDYWQYNRRYRRGDGTIWPRDVLRTGNPQALARARNALGR